MFGLFGKKDPVCGMKEKKGEGILKSGKWFCSKECLNEYERQQKTGEKRTNHASHSCCGGHH